MFDYVHNIRSRNTAPCTWALMEQALHSPWVSDTCAEIADAREARLRGDLTPEEWEAKKGELKRRLPGFTFHAHFREGRRLNANAEPSGLSMLDIDHMASPRTFYHERVEPRLAALRVVLAHVTPSGEGLRLVFVLAPGEGLVEGQRRVASALGLDGFDEACKDLARCSFAVPERYVLHLDRDALFADHAPAPAARVAAATPDAAPQPSLQTSLQTSSPTSLQPSSQTSLQTSSQTSSPTSLQTSLQPSSQPSSQTSENDNNPDSPSPAPAVAAVAAGARADADAPRTAPDRSSLKIFDEALAAVGLRQQQLNAVGTRHNSLVSVLSSGICRLMSQQQLLAVVAARMPGYAAEPDCRNLVRDFYAKYTDPQRPMSERLRRIFADSLGSADDDAATAPDTDDHAADDARRLGHTVLRLAPPGLRETLRSVPADMRMPVLCAVMPLAAAYADQVTVRYCDNAVQRLGLMSIIVGPQASGKSACKSAVDLWLRQMADEDARARAIEERWKQDARARKANEKAPEDPCVLVRSVPVTISCSTLLRRLKNSRGHCLYSFGEELDTLRKTNGAGAWASKYDVYRLAFDNGRWGQDYNSDQAESGVVPVAYNFSILGTYGALRKCFRADNVENGLSSRVIIAEMPSAAFAPMPAYAGTDDADTAAAVDRAVTALRAASGFVDTPRLRAAIGRWVEARRVEAMADGDLVKDTYRRRAAVIGFRCGVVARLLEGKESKRVVTLATTMAQYVLDGQCRVFGEALRNEYRQAGDEQTYKTENGTIFDQLPPVFTIDDLQSLKRGDASYNALRMIVSRWKKAGWVEKTGKNQWKKQKSENAYGTLS